MDNLHDSIYDAPLFQEDSKPRKGISLRVAVIFIVGTMCGSGILALPKALVLAGWSGVPMLIICGIISSYTGSLLGKCWLIIKERYPEYNNKQINDPYPKIGYHAAGKWGEVATRICVFCTLFGGGIVYLLLITGNIDNLIKDKASFHACYLIPIIAGFLLPFTWLGTPKDFWQAGIMAAVTTTLGAIFIVAGLAMMVPALPPAQHSNPSFSSFFSAFGTILFAFGGASVFPTIQVDMKDTSEFPKAVTVGIICVLAIYLSVSVGGFVVIGDAMAYDNILSNMHSGWILTTVIILITSHLLMGFVIVVNPVLQDLEGFFNVEDKFSWKRVIVRTLSMAVMTLVALGVPHFGVILQLVGATTIASTNFIFPPLFYILLSRQRHPGNTNAPPPEENFFLDPNNVHDDHEKDIIDLREQQPVPEWHNFDIEFHIKVLLVEIILIGVVGGIASVYSAISSLVDGSSGFTTACFLNWAVADL